MRKGELFKGIAAAGTPLWFRISKTKSGDCSFEVRAFQHRPSPLFSCWVTKNGRDYRFYESNKFKTIESAFNWGESKIDYKHNRLKIEYVEMLTKKEKQNPRF